MNASTSCAIFLTNCTLVWAFASTGENSAAGVKDITTSFIWVYILWEYYQFCKSLQKQR